MTLSNATYYRTSFCELPESFNSSQINASVVGIRMIGPQFIETIKGLGLRKKKVSHGKDLNSELPT